MFSIPFSVESGDPARLQYSKWPLSTSDDESARSRSILGLQDAEALLHYLQHSFKPDDIWTPERLEVNGRRGRRAVCVLGTDRIHYKIFDLDSVSNKEDESDEGMMQD